VNESLAVIPNCPGVHSGTPIYDSVHDQIWPRPPVRYVSRAEFQAAYAKVCGVSAISTIIKES